MAIFFQGCDRFKKQKQNKTIIKNKIIKLNIKILY